MPSRHNPFVYFDDQTNTLSANSAECIAHVRSFSQLATDLAGNKVTRYNFITPNLCDDMHDACSGDPIAHGDEWLKKNVPAILNSTAYRSGGALFIVWDEEAKGDGPIPMIILSPFAKGSHCPNSLYYTQDVGFFPRSLFDGPPFPPPCASALGSYAESRSCSNSLLLARSCTQADVEIDERGRKRVCYTRYQTPLETLLALERPAQYLRHGVGINALNRIAAVLIDTGDFYREYLNPYLNYAPARPALIPTNPKPAPGSCSQTGFPRWPRRTGQSSPGSTFLLRAC